MKKISQETFTRITVSLLIALVIYSQSSHSQVIISNTDKLIVKQVGEYTCWAATIEAIEKYKGNNVSQREVINAMVQYFYNKKLSDKEFEELKPSSDLAIKDSLLNFVFVDKRVIDRNEIERVINMNQPVIFVANNHISLIVGYEKSHYFIMDTYFGDIRKVKKTKIAFLSKDPKFSRKAIFMKIDSNPLIKVITKINI